MNNTFNSLIIDNDFSFLIEKTANVMFTKKSVDALWRLNNNELMYTGEVEDKQEAIFDAIEDLKNLEEEYSITSTQFIVSNMNLEEILDFSGDCNWNDILTTLCTKYFKIQLIELDLYSIDTDEN